MRLKRASTSRRGDGVEGAGEPFSEVAVGLVAVELVGPPGPVGISRHVVLEGVPERGHGAQLGALLRGFVAARDLAEDFLRQPARLVGGDVPVPADDDALVWGLPSAVPGAVVDDEGLGAGGITRTPKPVRRSSHAIQGLSAGWRASTARLVSASLVLAMRFPVFVSGYLLTL